MLLCIIFYAFIYWLVYAFIHYLCIYVNLFIFFMLYIFIYGILYAFVYLFYNNSAHFLTKCCSTFFDYSRIQKWWSEMLFTHSYRMTTIDLSVFSLSPTFIWHIWDKDDRETHENCS